MDFLEQIRDRLSFRERIAMSPGPVPSAVLLPVYLKREEYHILFTKRTGQLNHHGGEISFPGGVCSCDDAGSMQTALRETFEEVGILPGDVEVLGVLDDFFSIHNYLVTPYVGHFAQNYHLAVNSQEIERIIEVPLRHLLSPEIYRTEDWSHKGRTYEVDFFTYGADEIWGLTAAILKQFLDLVFPERVGVGR
jgi:8-oxo-dGTP pyrophosphatase MutT (NUDIX family)